MSKTLGPTVWSAWDHTASDRFRSLFPRSTNDLGIEYGICELDLFQNKTCKQTRVHSCSSRFCPYLEATTYYLSRKRQTLGESHFFIGDSVIALGSRAWNEIFFRVFWSILFAGSQLRVHENISSAAYDCFLEHTTPSHPNEESASISMAVVAYGSRCNCPQVKCKRSVVGVFLFHFVYSHSEIQNLTKSRWKTLCWEPDTDQFAENHKLLRMNTVRHNPLFP